MRSAPRQVYAQRFSSDMDWTKATNAGGLTEHDLFDAGFISSTLGGRPMATPRVRVPSVPGIPPARGTMSSVVDCPPPQRTHPTLRCTTSPLGVMLAQFLQCANPHLAYGPAPAFPPWADRCTVQGTHGPVLPHVQEVDGFIPREGRP